MKKHTIQIIMCAVGVLLLCGCDISSNDNGKLDGMWHLITTETLSTGDIADHSQQRLYWNIQSRLLQLEDKDYIHPSCLLRFEQNGMQLRVFEPYRYNREEGDEPLSDAVFLLPFGISQTDETFLIEQINSKYLIMKSEEVRLSFRKQ